MQDVLRFRWERLALKTHWAALRKKPLWKLHREWVKDETLSHNAVGEIGEDLAVQFLKAKGFGVLYRNFKPRRGGEIDVVCRDGNALVFIEVKTRLAPSNARPAQAITKDKKEQLKKGASQYLHLLQREEDSKYPSTGELLDIPVRFDVVEVMLEPGSLPSMNLIKGILSDSYKNERNPFQKSFH